MNRRAFLRTLGGAALVAATPGVLLVEPEPVRRYWQVSAAAPVLAGFDTRHATSLWAGSSGPLGSVLIPPAVRIALAEDMWRRGLITTRDAVRLLS